MRGIPPTEDELATLETDPNNLASLLEIWLESDEFGEVMQDYHADWLQLRTDSVLQLPAIGVLSHASSGEMYESTTEGPLHLIDHVVAGHLPYTELLTADYTFVDSVVAAIYGLPYDPTGQEWQQVYWNDGRPAAGLLSTGEMLVRWDSNSGNYNRHRANFVADKFLCEDFDDRDVLEPGIAGGDDIAIASAASQNPACATCHQALDPLAGYFWGFRNFLHPREMGVAYNDGCDWTWDLNTPIEPGEFSGPEAYCYPIRQYIPAYEDTWVEYDLPPPSFYGNPLPDLGALAVAISRDRRFSQCVTRRLTAWMSNIEPDEVPDTLVLDLESSFLESAYDIRSLVRAVVTSEPFARAPGDASDPFAKMRTVRSEQYAATLQTITGFVWEVVADSPDCGVDPLLGSQCWGSVDLLRSDRWGFRTMMGGSDGYFVAFHDGATSTRLLAYDAAAWSAASFTAQADLALPVGDPARRVLSVGADATDSEVAAEVSRLFTRFTGEAPGPDSDGLTALWLAQRETSDPTSAWIATIAALLLDPRLQYM